MSDACTSHCWRRSLATVIVSLLVSPVAADLVFAIMVGALPDFAAADGRVHVETDTGFWVAAFVAMFALPFAFIGAGLQAAIGGALLAAYGWFRGPPPLSIVLVLAIVAFACGHYFGLFDHAHDWAPAWLVMHVVPAVVTWLAIRPIWRDVAEAPA